MRLCNPDCLIEWQETAAPKYKKDWPGKLLRVREFPRGYMKPFLPPDGAVCRINRRYCEFSGGQFTLELHWSCPACGRVHQEGIAESLVQDGQAAFVEASGLADATCALDEARPALVYLASPYSNPDLAVRGIRAARASLCAAWLMNKGWSVLSPLSMGHAIWSAYPALSGDFMAWREPCLRMLESSDALAVLMLDGVETSAGVAAEIDHARRLGIPLNQIRLGGPDDGEPFEVVSHPTWWR